tara:strand:+ start:868 stop:1293 length:426 start_codon:yes stop_codon:yes gene_type:complete
MRAKDLIPNKDYAITSGAYRLTRRATYVGPSEEDGKHDFVLHEDYELICPEEAVSSRRVITSWADHEERKAKRRAEREERKAKRAAAKAATQEAWGDTLETLKSTGVKHEFWPRDYDDGACVSCQLTLDQAKLLAAALSQD